MPTRMRPVPCTALAAALALAGCKVGPDYRPPRVDMPDDWVSPTAAELVASSQPSVPVVAPADLARWWAAFDDPVLTALVHRALEANPDLGIATARVRQARYARRLAGAALYPTVDASAAYRRSKSAGNDDTRGTERGLYQAGLDAAWEIDVFGGVRRSIEAAAADLRAALADQRDVQVILAAEVALNYLDLRSLQRQLVISRENLDAQRRSADVTRRRVEIGLEAGLDLANAESLVFNTEAQLPLQEAAIRQVMYALSVLLGLAPGALLDELSEDAPIPMTPPVVPVGLPSDLLRRRPDIRRAEAQLHAATARIGVAIADLYPRFALNGSLGVSGDRIQALSSRRYGSWSIGPSVSWPLFDAGRIRANIAIQTIEQEQAILNYRATILTALQEVESALVAFVAEQEHRRMLTQVVEAERRAVDLSTKLYKAGEIEFVNVLVAQRGLYASEEALVQSDRNVAANLVALYKALGGGWQSEVGTPPIVEREVD